MTLVYLLAFGSILRMTLGQDPCGTDNLRVAMLNLGYGTDTESNSMSDDDVRNTIIRELSKICNEAVPTIEGYNDYELLGKIYHAYVLSKARARTSDQLIAMSTEDQRNTVIVEINKRSGYTSSIASLQGRSDIDLSCMFWQYCWCEWPNTYDFADIYGYWVKIMSCGGGDSCSMAQAIAITELESCEVTTEFETSFTTSASATMGFEWGGLSGSATLELSATARNSIAQSTIKSISQSISIEQEFECGPEEDAMYQWKTHSTVTRTTPFGKANEVTTELDSKEIWCVSDDALQPQCPFGYCADDDCQECDQFSDEAIGTQTSSTTSSTTSTSYQANDSLEDEEKESSNPTMIIGIIVVVLCIVLCIVAALIYCIKNSKGAKQPNKQTPVPGPVYQTALPGCSVVVVPANANTNSVPRVPLYPSVRSGALNRIA